MTGVSGGRCDTSKVLLIVCRLESNITAVDCAELCYLFLHNGHVDHLTGIGKETIGVVNMFILYFAS